MRYFYDKYDKIIYVSVLFLTCIFNLRWCRRQSRRKLILFGILQVSLSLQILLMRNLRYFIRRNILLKRIEIYKEFLGPDENVVNKIFFCGHYFDKVFDRN